MTNLSKRTLIIFLFSTFFSLNAFAQLTVIESIPANNASNVELNTNITITFSEVINTAEINENTIIVNGEYSGVINGTFSFPDNQTVVFNPNEGYLQNEKISLILTNGINAISNAEFNPKIISFTTESNPSANALSYFRQDNEFTGSTNSPSNFDIVDLDGDDDLDIVISYSSPSQFGWLENDGSNNYVFQLITDNISPNIATGDFDNDDDIDIVSTNNGITSWFENDGNQNFTENFIANNSFGAIELGDLNADGFLDIVIRSGSIETLISNSSQTYTLVTQAETSISFTGSQIADIDNDGDLDIISINFSGELLLLSNDGNGNFSTIDSLPNVSIGGRNSLRVGDLDLDNDLDIAVFGSNGSGLSWVENQGNNEFNLINIADIPELEFNNGSGIDLADIDGDNDIDIIVGSDSFNRIFLFENENNGNFSSNIIFTDDLDFELLEIVDIDSDGDQDIISASFNAFGAYINDVPTSSEISFMVNGMVIENGGTVSLGKVVINQENNYPINITNNGENRLIIQNAVLSNNFMLNQSLEDTIFQALSNRFNLSINPSATGNLSGSLTFDTNDENNPQYSIQFNVEAVESINVTSISPANGTVFQAVNSNLVIDFDEEILAESITSDNIFIQGSISGLMPFQATVNGNSITLDPDRDFSPGERINVVLNNQVESTNNILLENSFGYHFDIATSFENENPIFFRNNTLLRFENNLSSSFNTGHFNDDEFTDFIFHRDNSSLLFLGSEDGSITAADTSNYSISVGFAPLTGDFNADGFSDLLTFRFNQESYILANDGQGMLTEQSIGFSLQDINTIADITLDGLPDIIGIIDGNLNILVNQGNFQFEKIFVFDPIESGIIANLSIVDINNDGNLDIVGVDNNGFADIFWLENDGDLNFELNIIGGGRFNAITTVDFDNDGDLDILTAGGFSSTMQFYENDGNANFSRNVLDDLDASFIQVFDFNGDNQLDILTSNTNTQEIVLLQNEAPSSELSLIALDPSLRRENTIVLDGDNDQDLDIYFLERVNGSPRFIFLENDSPQPSNLLLNRLETSFNNGDTLKSIVTSGETHTFAFDLSNIGEEILNVSAITTNDQITLVNELPIELSQNNTEKLFFEVASQANGIFLDSVILQSNSSINPLFKLVMQLDVRNSLAVASSVPANGGQNINPQIETISFTLDAPLDASTINNESINISGQIAGRIEGDYSIENSNTIVFTPNKPFLTGDEISIVLTPMIMSENNISLVNGYHSSFKIGVVNNPLSINSFRRTEIASSNNVNYFGVVDIDQSGLANFYYSTFNQFNISGFEEERQSFNNFFNSNRSVITTDIDGDGDLDFVSGMFANSKLSWFENIDGQFDNERPISEFRANESIQSADIDGDGRIDIIATSSQSLPVQEVIWYKNTPNGFIAENILTYLSGTQGNATIDVIDFDSDGDIDIIFAGQINQDDGAVNSIALLENIGNGTFKEPFVFVSGINRGTALAGDIDNDGNMDIIVNQAFDDTFWLKNNGNMTFTRNDLATAFDINAIFDLDGDGDQDLLNFNRSWLINDGSQNFTELSLDENNTLTGTNQLFDYNGDGDIDILVNSFSSSQNLIIYETLRDASLSVTSNNQTLTDNDEVTFGTTAINNLLNQSIFLINEGESPLSFSATLNSNNFTIEGEIPSSISAGESIEIPISFTAGTNGTFNATLLIDSNDPLQSSFTINLNSVVDIVPEINLSQNGRNIVIGDTLVFEGILGSSIVVPINITNSGSADLTLTNPSLSDLITLQNQLPASLSFEGENAFEAGFQLSAVNPGTFTETISIPNNDPDENPFNFIIEWEIAPNGFTVSDDQNNQLVENSTFDFGNLTLSEIVRRTFTLTNIGESELIINEVNLPVGITLNTSLPISIQTGMTSDIELQVEGNSEQQINGVISITGISNNEDITRAFNVSAEIVSPDFQLESENSLITNGATIDFGVIAINETTSNRFIFTNIGLGDLILSEITLPTNFTINGDFPDQVEAFSNEVFTVDFSASEVGVFEGLLRFETNDPSNRIFELTLIGEAVANPVPQLTINSNRGILISGSSFDFGSTISGEAILQQFSVINNGTAPLTVENLAVAPSENFIIVGTVTEVLPRESANFSIIFSNDQNGTSEAILTFDTNDPEIPTFEVMLTASVVAEVQPEIIVQNGPNNINDGGSFTFRNTLLSESVQTTFTIFNAGRSNLIVSNLALPEGFMLIGDFPESNLTDPNNPSAIIPGGMGFFTILFDANMLGTTQGTLSFNTNDADESIFNIDLTGNVLTPAEINVTIDGGEIFTDGSFDFGQIAPGENLTANLIISNLGGFELLLSDFSISDSFTLTSDFPTVVSGNSAIELTLQFSNTESDTFEGILSFSTNDPERTTYQIGLTATTIITSTNSEDLSNFNLYPNPTAGNLSLKLNEGIVENMDLEITDLSGKLIWKKSLQNTDTDQVLNISLNSIKSGVYNLSIRTNSDKIINNKIIIEK